MEKLVIITAILFAIGCQGSENATENQSIFTSTTPMPLATTQIFLEEKQDDFPIKEIPGKKILNAIKWIMSFTEESFVGRCLGAARRLKFVMPFLLFKMGVIVTTLGFLTMFTLKGLTIGVLLLILNAGGIFGKLALLKHHQMPHPKEHYIPISPPQSPPSVHLHVHKDPHGGHYDEGHGGFESLAPTAWSDRISQGLSETKTLAEKLELINLYKRLGFNVNSVLSREGQFKKY